MPANARRADEAGRRLGLDHADGVARLDGQARQLDRLVGGDAAADAEQEARHWALVSRGSGT